MGKLKINLKSIMILFGVILTFCLIPIGIQAFATDSSSQATLPAADPGCPDSTPSESAAPVDASVTGESEPTVPANATMVYIETGQYVYTLNDEKAFPLVEGDEVDLSVVIDHVGYMYINHSDGSRTCIAAAFYDGDFKKFSYWNETGSSIEGDKIYAPVFEDYDPAVPENHYFYRAGIISDADDYSGIEGADVTWVNLENHEYITQFTNNFGFVCLKIPLDIKGSIHVVATNYVSDYTMPESRDVTDTPMMDFVSLGHGAITTVQSNLPGVDFHVREYVRNAGTAPDFKYTAEDLYISEIPTRMLSYNACLAVLSDEECDQFGVKHGTLYYHYMFGGMLGGKIYEITFEPNADYEIENWVITDSTGSQEMVIDQDYYLNQENEPYVFQLNYVAPPAPPVTPDEPAVTETTQTGDCYGLIVAALAGMAVVCGVISFRRFRKLNR